MKKLTSLIFLAAAAPLAACGASDVAGNPDATPPPGATFDAGAVLAGDAPAPDFVCLSHQPATTAIDPLVVAGTIETITNSGTLQPVDAAELALFRTGEPVVLARGHSDATGAFTTGAVASGGHPLHAYLKATKPGYRTTFLYPPFALTKSATTVPLPMISDAMFTSVASSLGATQDDHANGVLLVAVADCKSQPLAGATLTVTHGNGGAPAGHAYDLGTILPGAGGLFLVFDVPDGKVHVSASYSGMPLPEHDVMVRAQDPDCATARGTLTATAVVPGP